MLSQDSLLALAGGLIIGLSVSVFLATNGRITGISGIAGGLFCAERWERAWRWVFVAGLLVGGLILQLVHPASFHDTTERGWGAVILAGLLVGFGTSMGSGCTSGHGVCGMSRLSPRSLVATLTFTLAGVAAVWLVRLFVGGAA